MFSKLTLAAGAAVAVGVSFAGEAQAFNVTKSPQPPANSASVINQVIAFDGIFTHVEETLFDTNPFLKKITVSNADKDDFPNASTNTLQFSAINNTGKALISYVISFGGVNTQIANFLASTPAGAVISGNTVAWSGLNVGVGSSFNTSLSFNKSALPVGTFDMTQTVTQVPTPALLPGLLGLGVAALRRKQDDSVEENV